MRVTNNFFYYIKGITDKGDFICFKKKEIIVLCLLFYNFHLYSQNSQLHNALIQKLSNDGFENLTVNTFPDRVIVYYENRVFRFDVEALKMVVNAVVPFISNQRYLILVPLNRKIPIIYVEIPVADCRNYLELKLSGKEFAEKLKINFNIDELYKYPANEELENSSSFRFDIALKPQFHFEFGPYGKPVTTQINAIPEIQTSLWKGIRFNYEIIVPVINEFGPRSNTIRPGVIALNQVFRLPENYFISATFGLFTQDRYGFDLEIKKYILNSNMSFGLNLGITSTAYFSSMTRYFYNNSFSYTGSISCDYRVPEYDLTIGLMAGKFLMDDKSLRLDIRREFGEVEIGFFALCSTAGISNGGVNITIPLSPSSYWNPGIVRFKTSEQFSLSYLVKTDPTQMIGLRYNTGNRLDYFNKKLNPDFIKNYFTKH